MPFDSARIHARKKMLIGTGIWSTDSPLRPSGMLAIKAASVIPAPLLARNGPRRFDAFIVRVTAILSTFWQIPVRKRGRASIRKPGFTPVPSTLLPAFFAAASISAAA